MVKSSFGQLQSRLGVPAVFILSTILRRVLAEYLFVKHLPTGEFPLEVSTESRFPMRKGTPFPRVTLRPLNIELSG